MNTDDYTQPVEAVIAQERAAIYPVPLKAKSYSELFTSWVEVNPDVMHEMEMVALSIDTRGMRVSTKYLIERMRYESRKSVVKVPFIDQYGVTHEYVINNTVTPLIGRWLLERHPEMRIEIRKSMFDELDRKDSNAIRQKEN